MDVESIGHSFLDLTDSFDLTLELGALGGGNMPETARTSQQSACSSSDVHQASISVSLLEAGRALCGDELVTRPFAVALRGVTASVCARLQKLNDASEVLGLRHIQLLRHCMRVATAESLGIGLDLVLGLYETMQRLESVSEAREAVDGVLMYAMSLAPYDIELSEAIDAIQKGESPTWAGGRPACQSKAGSSMGGSFPDSMPRLQYDILVKEFSTHDLDKDGRLKGAEEVTQVCLALCAKLRLLVAPAVIDARVTEAIEKAETEWTIEAFQEWFTQAFEGGGA